MLQEGKTLEAIGKTLKIDSSHLALKLNELELRKINTSSKQNSSTNDQEQYVIGNRCVSINEQKNPYVFPLFPLNLCAKL